MERAILIVLDGFGIGKDSPFNAIKNAKMPFYQELVAKYPHSQLVTHGHAVGLPDGVMGNSEVGHMTMGAGRIIYQDLTRISKSVEDGDFFKNPVLLKTIQAGALATGRVHLMGLLSDGGVHSHIDHLLALLDLCTRSENAASRGSLFFGRAGYAAGLPPESISKNCCATPRSKALNRPNPTRQDRHGRRPLLRHGPRQALGARRERLTRR